MIQSLFLAVVLLAPSFANARVIKNGFELRIKNEPVQKFTVLAEEGHEARIQVNHRILRFTSRVQGGDLIWISSEIIDDSRKIAQPKLVVRLNHEAEISAADSAGKPLYSLKWKPTQQD